ncbi:MAG: hypothetical protein IH934_04660 [Nanoarchaeota archaeon]|nr:hypothetical protein [Nanoarchaeota archaeon]
MWKEIKLLWIFVLFLLVPSMVSALTITELCDQAVFILDQTVNTSNNVAPLNPVHPTALTFQ